MLTEIYTIGHGRHEFGYFLELLRKYGVGFVCDVRSVARSRWPQFNGMVLAELLREQGIGYEHLPECGGKTRPTPGRPLSGSTRSTTRSSRPDSRPYPVSARIAISPCATTLTATNSGRPAIRASRLGSRACRPTIAMRAARWPPMRPATPLRPVRSIADRAPHTVR